MTSDGALENPTSGTAIYQHTFEANGWAAPRDGRSWAIVRVLSGNLVLGSTTICYRRSDVAEKFGDEFLAVGFSLRCALPEILRSVRTLDISCEAEYDDGTRRVIATCPVAVSPVDYRAHAFGGILVDGHDSVLSRNQVYSTGAPAERADEHCAQLVRRYLIPGEHVLDVGCGIGAWSHALTPYGINWFGVETRPDFVELMHAQGLDAGLVGETLPFPAPFFDATICIEVLEHVIDPAPFLAQVAAVSRRIGIFSVPNFGAIPLTAERYAVPWHMLEGDHKWFFTAESLHGLLKPYYKRVETFEYGELEHLQSIEGLPVRNHIMAVGLHS